MKLYGPARGMAKGDAEAYVPSFTTDPNGGQVGELRQIVITSPDVYTSIVFDP